MLRIIQNTHAGSAKSYYAASDYYSEGQELVGRWGGKAASLLGLEGTVDQRAFDALCDNLHPQTGKQLTPRLRDDRTVGYDFNFHVPKSVSLLYEIGRDERILDAFRAAVGETMGEIEADMKTRVRKQGENAERATGNLLWAEFIHFTSRPVDGLPDPLLHAHCFAFNVTHDPQERRWKAGQFRDIKRDAPYYQAAFHVRLANKLADLGYGIERQGKAWEVSGISRKVIERFSRRTEQIEETARRKGLTSPDDKAALGAKTRQNKQNDLGREELRGEWIARLSPDELAALLDVAGTTSLAALPARQQQRSQSDREAVQHAVRHCLERDSVIPEMHLLAEAMRHGVGRVTVEGIRREAQRQAILAPDEPGGRMLATTAEVLAEERKMLQFASQGRGTCPPLSSAGGVHPFRREWLNEGQKEAVRHVLTSGDRVMLIRGAAGVGKTSLMQEAVEAIEAGGRKVFTFAPSAEASRGVLRKEGFDNAETVAKLLDDAQLQRDVVGQVIWIDEAGLLGSRTLAKVFDLARDTGARVILSGDRHQHGAVERGAALRLLEERAGLPVANVRQIQRQTGRYREAVADFSEGLTGAGFEKLDALGWVVEAGDGERERLMAEEYVKAVQEGKSVLAVSPTHAEGERISEAIRSELRDKGMLGEEDREFVRLHSRNWTEAERADAALYQVGDVVQFNRGSGRFKAGTRFVVSGEEGRLRLPPLDHADRFGVFRIGAIRLAAGDWVRITQNGTTADRKHRLNNGSLYQVRGFTPEGNITLANGWVVGKDFGHLAHGYVLTSHASQGKTVDRVLIGQGAASLPATSREQFYVSASRGREQVRVFTDNKEALRDAVGRERPRTSAVELLERQSKPPGGSKHRKAAQARRRRLLLQTRSESRDATARATEFTRKRELSHARK